MIQGRNHDPSSTESDIFTPVSSPPLKIGHDLFSDKFSAVRNFVHNVRLPLLPDTFKYHPEIMEASTISVSIAELFQVIFLRGLIFFPHCLDRQK